MLTPYFFESLFRWHIIDELILLNLILHVSFPHLSIDMRIGRTYKQLLDFELELIDCFLLLFNDVD